MSSFDILILALIAGSVLVRLYFLFSGRMPHEAHGAMPARLPAHVNAAHRHRAIPRQAGAAIPRGHNVALGLRLHGRRRALCRMRLTPSAARALPQAICTPL